MALLQVNYLSRALFRTIPLNVILPADKVDYNTFSYAMKDGYKFKTLYLMHGVLGNYTDWISGTRIQRWAEEKNLAVIMPSGDNAFYVDSRIPKNEYGELIGKELLEVTRKMFPLSDRREDTFIGGLSMGGYGAIRNGIMYSDNFSHVIGLSSAVHFFDKNAQPRFMEKAVFGDLDKAALTDVNPRVAYDRLLESKKPIPKFYLSCGTEDNLFSANVAFKDFLVSKGADVTWYEGKGGHDWDFWDAQIKQALDWLPLEGNANGLGSGNVKLD